MFVHVAPTAVVEVVGLHAMAIIALALVVAKVGPTPNLHHPNMVEVLAALLLTVVSGLTTTTLGSP